MFVCRYEIYVVIGACFKFYVLCNGRRWWPFIYTYNIEKFKPQALSAIKTCVIYGIKLTILIKI